MWGSPDDRPARQLGLVLVGDAVLLYGAAAARAGRRQGGVKGLLRLVGPQNEWRTFHQAGCQRVLDRYTWERTSEGYLRVIEEMLGNQPTPGQDEGLPIPAYFSDPKPELDLTVDLLLDIWPIAPPPERAK